MIVGSCTSTMCLWLLVGCGYCSWCSCSLSFPSLCWFVRWNVGLWWWCQSANFLPLRGNEKRARQSGIAWCWTFSYPIYLSVFVCVRNHRMRYSPKETYSTGHSQVLHYGRRALSLTCFYQCVVCGSYTAGRIAEGPPTSLTMNADDTSAKCYEMPLSMHGDLHR